VQSFERLKHRWVDILKRAGYVATSVPLHAYFKKRIPIEGVKRQNGTCRMGINPLSSILDPNCKAHDLVHVYVVDAACFVSASAVNPSLTIIDHHCQRHTDCRPPIVGMPHVITPRVG
jgi:hypothetical protein